MGSLSMSLLLLCSPCSYTVSLPPPSSSSSTIAKSLCPPSSFPRAVPTAAIRRLRLLHRRCGYGGDGKKESMFVDENGVVEDMDGYLNYLSPEYESVWDTKPSWCQPWTITLTGALVIGCSWLILHSIVATTVVSFLIGTWWYLFLYAYPKEYSNMIAERRKRIRSGIEDTFGWSKAEGTD